MRFIHFKDCPLPSAEEAGAALLKLLRGPLHSKRVLKGIPNPSSQLNFDANPSCQRPFGLNPSSQIINPILDSTTYKMMFITTQELLNEYNQVKDRLMMFGCTYLHLD